MALSLYRSTADIPRDSQELLLPENQRAVNQHYLALRRTNYCNHIHIVPYRQREFDPVSVSLTMAAILRRFSISRTHPDTNDMGGQQPRKFSTASTSSSTDRALGVKDGNIALDPDVRRKGSAGSLVEGPPTDGKVDLVPKPKVAGRIYGARDWRKVSVGSSS